MKTAFFNPASGVSGDMVLGSLVDCGLPVSDLCRELGVLGLQGWSLESSAVTRGGIRGTHVRVSVPCENVHRHLSDITGMIGSCDLDPWVKEKSILAFTLLAQAEAHAHGVAVEEVHFHEVGAMDAILDVVGSFAGLRLLGVERVCSAPVALGTGTVRCAHGTMPVPVPAVVRLLLGIPVVRTGVPCELATPTGAAILRAAVEEWDCSPSMIGHVSGMGAGSRDIPGTANMLGVVIGQGSPFGDRSLVLETIVDDMEPRLWPELSSALQESGALDVWCVPCLGRKGRPALSVVVIAREQDRSGLLDVLFRNSTTLGVRERYESRVALAREFRTVRTPWGTVSVKLGLWRGEVVNAMPEFTDCHALAEASGVPVKAVLDCARGLAAELLDV